ncbi:hypothetical protein PMAYCL1PPCAC_30650 [Pristionchus mayeri]|uniref:Uncharacterized protein n=1 Tax=Pristionchus mayeri TaxID=1317129 RepID=A0AAN5DD28_9BILA|nr:hypothetical protein PMAYCL1PPCAC_30650 [Pristionchus mayeri]
MIHAAVKMASRRSSADNKRRNSPKKKQDKKQAAVVPEPKPEPVPAPSSSSSDVPFPLGRRPVFVRRVMDPLPEIDGRIQNQIKAAEIAYMATQFVMAVCFIFVPYTCYKNMFYLPQQEQMGMGGEPWEQYFELV